MFATKKSLICELTQETEPAAWKKMGFKDGEVTGGRVWVWKYGFVLPTVDEVAAVKKELRVKAGLKPASRPA